MKKILYALTAVGLVLTACQEIFEPAADPQAWPQEDARTLPDAFSVSPVAGLNLADVTSDVVKIATLGSSTLPEDASYGPFTLVLEDGAYSMKADENLQVSKEALQEAVTKLFGKKPVEHTLKAIINSSVQIDGQGFRLLSNEFEIKVTPEAPNLESHYYYVGAANGWSTRDKTYELTNTSGNYYDNPVISVTIPAPLGEEGERIDNWFKIAPGSRYEAADFWDGDFIGAAENGESAYKGSYVIGHDVGAFNVGPATEEALYYNISINLMEQTYEVKVLNFPDHLFMIGEEFGGWDWNSDGVVEMVPVVYQPDWGPGCSESEAQFWTVRYFTANKGFKFCSKREWDGDFWGLTTNEGFVEVGGNCTVTESGIYLVHIDMKRQIVHVEPARVYGIGDCFGGWDTAMEDARFIADGKKLKATTIKAGELRMYVESEISNSDWWTREFVFFDDGIIDYRGDDRGQGDQPRFKVKKDQVITLDFNAGTGTVTGEGEGPKDPEAWSLRGTMDGSDWGVDYDLSSDDGEVWTIKGVNFVAGDEFKIRADHDWAISVGGPEANAESTIDPTNPYGVYNPVIGEAFATGSTNIRIPEDGIYSVTLTYNDNPTILIEEYKAYPDHLYMIGDEFGGWDWNSDGVVEMIPVLHNPDWGANAEGQFWTVRYISANKGFKFNSVRSWGGDFWGLTTNEGFVEAGGNCTVTEDGVYLVHIDLKNGIVHVEPARIMGKGDCFGGWDVDPVVFAAEGNKVVGTTTTAGKLRMYVESGIATSDWWTREFLFYDGVITYRGGGGDLTDVMMEAGKTITLDFNAGTASVE